MLGPLLLLVRRFSVSQLPKGILMLIRFLLSCSCCICFLAALVPWKSVFIRVALEVVFLGFPISSASTCTCLLVCTYRQVKG